MKIKSLIVAMSGVLASGTAHCIPIDYSPSRQDAATQYTGSGRGETYNVAIQLNSPTMTGMKVSALSVPLPSGCEVTDISGWLTGTLAIKVEKGKRVNAPDITSVEAKISEGKLTADFGEEYTIPAEGLYIGYTFTVADGEGSNATPLAVTPGVSEGSLYLYTSRQYMTWEDRSEKLNAISAMTVTLDGKEYPVSVQTDLPELQRYSYRENSFTIPVSLTSYGTQPLSSIDYSYTCGDKSGKGTFKFTEAQAMQWGHSFTADLEIEGVGKKGKSPIVLTVDKVNTLENDNVSKSAEGEVYGLYTVPVHRPLVEEYTGLGCGYCPRGIAGIEYMYENYADDFIGVSIHDNDAMSIFARADYPCTTSVFPSAWLDRKVVTDPYFGENESGTALAAAFGFDKEWQKQADIFSPVDIKAYAYWDPENPERIKVETETVFVEPVDRKYRVAYYLLHDAMEGEKWLQLNYFAGWEAMNGIEQMYQFVYGESYINIYHNNVAIMSSDTKGVEGSLPDKIETDRPYYHTFTFTPSQAENLAGSPLLQDKDYLRVVAYIVDDYASSNVVNACKAEISDTPSGIEAVSSEDCEVVKTEYFNLNGMQISSPCTGVTIKVETMSDGTRRTTKHIL